MSDNRPLNVENVLRSRWGRLVLAVALVVGVSFAYSVPRFELAELRGRETARLRLFMTELVGWSLWALAAWPLVACARWLMEATRSWILALLIQLPLSLAAGWGFVELDQAFRRTLEPPLTEEERQRQEERRERQERFDRPDHPDRAGRGPGERSPFRRGRRGESPDWGSPFWRFRWMQAVLVYWVILGLGAGYSSFLSMREKERRAADLELRAERLRAELARAQLGSLRNQLNPHFLFNALHSIGGLVRARQEAAALKTLAAIGELLRSTLEHGAQEEVSLADELRTAERFLEIERIRLGDRLKAVTHVDPALGKARVPSLLLLPLVENAVKHGLADLPEGGQVEVEARREGARLVLEVRDDGLGFPPEVLAAGASPAENGRRGIGLQNTRERLEALFGADQHLELENAEPRGAVVRLTLPYREEAEEAAAGETR